MHLVKKSKMNSLLLKRSWMWICFCGVCYAIPSIVEQPTDQKVLQSGDVTLRCVVEGIPHGVENPVQWTKGNFALGYDLLRWNHYSMIGDVTKGEFHLQIRNASLAEDDVYECQVTHYQLRSKAAKLTVLVPPSGPFVDDAFVSDDSTLVDVVVDKENKITCRALRGTPAATLQWFQGDKELKKDVESEVSSPVDKLYDVSSTLRVTPTINDGDVTYNCVMRSDAIPLHGSKLIRFKFNLLEPPKVSVHLPEAVRDGEHLEAQCRSYADPPATSFRWYLNEMVQIDESSATFNFGVVNRSLHGASIGCQAKNVAGYSKRNVNTINVLYMPVFLGGTDRIDADIGQNVTLRCFWDSNPKPQIYWFYENSDLVLGRESELHLPNVDQSDSGSYHCYASADKAEISKATTQLIVYGPPIFNHRMTQYIMLDEVAEIYCSLESYPGFQHVTWSWMDSGARVALRDNGKRRSADKKVEFETVFEAGSRLAILRINKAVEASLHRYNCAVTNSYGNKEAGINVQQDARTDQVSAISTATRIAAGIAALLVSLLLLGSCCAWKSRQQKSTNFDKLNEMLFQNNHEKVLRSFKKSESAAISDVSEAKSGAYRVRSLSLSSDGATGSSKPDSRGANPTSQSGQDDGYQTEEANSWSRNYEHADKADATSLIRKSSCVGYEINLSPASESADHGIPLLDGDQPKSGRYAKYPAQPLLTCRKQSDPAYAQIRRCPVVFAGRRSPAVGLEEFSYRDGVSTTSYSHQPNLYPTNQVYTSLQSISEPAKALSHFLYSNHPRLTPVPTNHSRPFPVPPTTNSFNRFHPATSQFSLDKFERESVVSNPATLAGMPKCFDNPGRNSRLSQSSKLSEFRNHRSVRTATCV